MNKRSGLIVAAAMLTAVMGLSGCEKKGPLQKAGEEVDEAARTLKNGGKETTADKLDDAGDAAAKAANKAKDAVTGN